MTDERDEAGTLLPDFRRLTCLGSFLRRSSLDELPQLVNVWKGEMSLVGPRPLLIEYLAHYSSEEKRRHAMRPGITGLAQVKGRNTIGWDDKFRLDLEYIDHWSLALDLKILWGTIFAISSRRGINYSAEVTMPKFHR